MEILTKWEKRMKTFGMDAESGAGIDTKGRE